MTESFAQLFEESLKEIETRPGSIVRGVVVAIDKDVVLVDAGLKSESAIPAEQFKNAQGELEIQVGDEVDVALDAVEDGFGETLLSREKAKRHEAWITLEKAYEDAETVTGVINGKVKGGFTVELNGIRAFLPGSLVDVRPVRDTLHLEGKELEFKVIKLDQKRNNVVVSRRAVIESENSAERDQLLENLQEGMEVKGIVKNLTDYGAFVAIAPGVEGLIHVSEMSWSQHLRSAQDFMKVGDEVEAVILTLDRAERKMSLGIKQLKEDPWEAIETKYPVGSKHTAKVRNFTNFGIFVELEEGVDGLIHISDLSWTKKVKHPSEFTSVGASIDVVVLEIDKENRRLSLGHKQLEKNPWDEYEAIYTPGSVHQGTITELMDKGAVVALAEGGEGFATPKHLTKEDGTMAKKGETLDFKVIEFVKETKRIILSHSRTFEEGNEPVAKPAHKRANGGRKNNNETAMINNVAASTSLGDIDALAKLKAQMEGKA
mgnify:CR=1 FL=1